MLTSQLVAKIGDLGVVKVVQGETVRKLQLTQGMPGTPDFMPPKALDVNNVYDASIDVFSFGGIALFVFTEKWPTPRPLKQRDPNTKKILTLLKLGDAN